MSIFARHQRHRNHQEGLPQVRLTIKAPLAGPSKLSSRCRDRCLVFLLTESIPAQGLDSLALATTIIRLLRMASLDKVRMELIILNRRMIGQSLRNRHHQIRRSSTVSATISLFWMIVRSL